MAEFIITAVLGLLVAVLGIINMTGNIASLHWYLSSVFSVRARSFRNLPSVFIRLSSGIPFK